MQSKKQRAFALTTLAGAIALSFHPAFAQSPTAGGSLPEVRVKAGAEKETATTPVIGYRAKNALTATKTDTPLSETAQSVTVVTRDQMVDQGATNVQDALNYAAGVRSDAYGIDSRSDGMRIRGAYPDEYQDGLRRIHDWYTSNTRTDPFTLERIEVLRGPAAMLFGQGTPAGVINLVSKRPQAERQGEIGVQIGSWGRKQVQVDLTGPLTQDGQWLYRLIAVGRDADTQVDYVRDDRALLAPSLTWRPNANTSLTLQAHWQKDKSGSTSQFFPWDGIVVANPNGTIPTNRFIGEPGFDRYNSERKSFGWMLEHRFNDQWQLRQNARVSSNFVDYSAFYGDFFSAPGTYAADPVNRRLYGRVADMSHTRAKMIAADQHLQGDFTTGAAAHKVLLGLDVSRYRKEVDSALDGPAYLGGTTSLIDVFTPVYTGYTPPALVAEPTSEQLSRGIYVQDQIRIHNWIITAGLRADRATGKLEGAADEKTSATTRRLGVMYKFGNGWAPYVSYAESFTPLAGTDFFNRRWAPLRGEQVEVGVKYESGSTSFTAAAYNLKEKNRQVPDPTNPSNQLQVGATKTDGMEFELKMKPTAAFDLVAHYNYTDLDKALEQLPKRQASVWGKLRFAIGGLTGFSAGAGLRHMSAFADAPAPQVDAVTLVDAMLAYETAQWRYALNISNLADKSYVATCLGRGDCWFGARRNVVATATYRF